MNLPERMRRNAWRVAWLVLLAAGAPAWGQDAKQTVGPRTPADQSAPRISDLRVGFAGRYKVGYWTAAEVTIAAGAEPFVGRVVVVAPDNDGIPTRVTAPAEGEFTLRSGETAGVPVYFKQGQLGGEITIELHDDNGLRRARTFRPGSAGSLAGVLPSSSRLLLGIGDRSASDRDTKPALTQLADFTELPDVWFGLEGVDAILLNTSDLQIVEQLKQGTRERAALDLWIRMGGRFILCVGRNAPQLLAAGGPLADFAPGTYQSMVPLRQGTVIEAYAQTTDPLAPGGTVELQVAQLSDVRGQIETFAGSGPTDLPLVVRTPRGFGEIVFVALDLDQPPLADWKARPQLLSQLLGAEAASAPPGEDEAAVLGAVTTLGFVDLAGQLRGALDQFPGVPLVPFWLVAVLIAAYLACIGPVDYYLVRHVLKRPESTWVTFTVTVLLFAGGAAGLTYALKGRDLRVNQLDVVDFDLESGFSRRTSLAGVFSPEIATYDLTFAPRQQQPPDSRQTADSGRLISWYGLTGSGFGGLDAAAGAGGGIGAASANLPLFSVGYEFNRQLDALHGVPIAVWSSKAFIERAWQQSAGGLEAQLADDGRLTGTIRNTLAEPLTHCVLIYGKWAYVIRDFPPGRELDLALDIDPQTVDTYLRKVTAVGDRKVAVPYDQTSFDVPRILEVMTAHELAEGKSYTGLSNRFLQFLELSNLVDRGRAVLIGRVAAPATALLSPAGTSPSEPLADDEDTQSWTFHRYVIPVSKQ